MPSTETSSRQMFESSGRTGRPWNGKFSGRDVGGTFLHVAPARSVGEQLPQVGKPHKAIRHPMTLRGCNSQLLRCSGRASSVTLSGLGAAVPTSCPSPRACDRDRSAGGAISCLRRSRKSLRHDR